MLVAGVDSSTQSTKVVLCRAEDGAASRVEQLRERTLAEGETWRDVRDAAIDIPAFAGRGMGYERLDQLALEHLYGIR